MDRRYFLNGIIFLTVQSKLMALETFDKFGHYRNHNKLSPKNNNGLRLIFGSCNKASRSQKHFKLFQSLNPDLFLWLGDCVYADTLDKNKLTKSFNKLKCDPYYRNFEKNFEIQGIWDDHDYGMNNSGKDYLIKEYSQQNYLDFLGVSDRDDRRNRKGVYHSFVRENVKFILFDQRYHKTENDLLGHEQWSWLEDQLRESHLDKNAVTILGSSITMIGPEYGGEGWHNTPALRKRLFNLLETYPQNKTIILSGDKHFSAFSKRTIYNKEYTEFMSSGMTHITPFFLRPYLKKHFGKQNCHFKKNFGVLDFNFNEGLVDLHSMNMDGEALLSRQIKFDLGSEQKSRNT